jgi:succinoglycan biosynthesis protein ExoW
MPGTAVIIPYFQRQEGLLTAAIRSALAQANAGPITVVVCDDESPLPAERDMASLTQDERNHVILVKQANAGPAPARNAALDAVPPGTDWIAFLDADDQWETWHLQRAQTALSLGYDFFFGDILREGSSGPQFAQIGFGPTGHTPLPDTDGLYAFEGDFFTPNLTKSPVCTTTVVMRYAVLGDLRFRTVPRVWEDLALWLEVSGRTRRITFDTRLQAHMAPGGITTVDGWRSNAELQRLLWYLQHFRLVEKKYSLTPVQKDIVRKVRARNATSFAKTVLALLRDGQRPKMALLRDYALLNPRIFAEVVRVICQKITAR